ncbi:MAG: hypothetical protein RIR62_1351 [Pseudomonadota bacterium]|jgi:NAD(P)-dependent dehydrogenase (short-subunit alcohol dehydrogenase family)
MTDAPESPDPGRTQDMPDTPDHGEDSYRGAGRLHGMAALITGGDSGIGRAVAIAFAREGADVAISYLDEGEDAQETARLIEQAGRKCLLLPGDIGDRAHCDAMVEQVVAAFGGIEVLVNNAAHQSFIEDMEEISDAEWDRTFRTNMSATFWLSRAAVRHMGRGASIINTTSINADRPNPQLLAYATTKGAIRTFTAGLAQMLAPRGIRVNCVAPGPIWTPLITATMPPDKVRDFGRDTPMGRAGQPVELVSTFVMLAEPLSSYVSGATVAVTGGAPML